MLGHETRRGLAETLSLQGVSDAGSLPRLSCAQAPVETSIIEKSHRDPVYDVWWLQGKTAYECAATASDGQVEAWSG